MNSALIDSMKAAQQRLRLPSESEAEQEAATAELARQLQAAKECFLIATAAACKLGRYSLADEIGVLRREVDGRLRRC